MTGSAPSRSKLEKILRPEMWLGAFLLWLSLSALRSRGTPFALVAETEWVRWAMGIGLALAVGAWLRRTRTAAIWAVMCAGVLSLAGALTAIEPGKTLLRGPFGDHQLYGSALLLVLPLTLAAAVAARDERWRLAALTALAAAGTCLALSGARSAWLGTAVGGVVFACFWLRGRFAGRQTRRARRETVVLVAAIVTVVLAAGALFSVAALQGAVSGRAATLQTLSADGSWQARLDTWRGTAQMIAARPLTGWGLGRYPYLQSHWTHAGRALAPNLAASLSEQAHSLYGQTAAETGLVGLALYGTAWVLFWRRGVLRLRALTQERTRADGRLLPPSSRDALCIASLSLLAAQMVDAVASPSWQYGVVSVPFWAAVGVGLAAFSRQDAPEASGSLLRRPARQALAGLAAVAIAAQWAHLGLLTPAQAYATPAGTTFVNVTLVGPTTISYSTSHTATYQLIGHYNYTATGLPAPDQDLTFDGSPVRGVGTVFVSSSVYANNEFGTSSANRNVLTLSSEEASKSTGTTVGITINYLINSGTRTYSSNVIVYP